MEKIAGYARIMARTMVEQQLNKTFLGRRYLRLGQCFLLWTYFFQLGCILGAKHSKNVNAFIPSFLGMHGDAEAVKRFVTKSVKPVVSLCENDPITFYALVYKILSKTLNLSGDLTSFAAGHGKTKVKPETAELGAWQYAVRGAVLGAEYPHMVGQLFEQTHTAASEENWERVRSMGVELPAIQEVSTYEEVERSEDELFMTYCRECCPELYSE